MIRVVLTGGKKMCLFGLILAFVDVKHILVGLELVGRVVWTAYFLTRILLNIVTKHYKLRSSVLVFTIYLERIYFYQELLSVVDILYVNP